MIKASSTGGGFVPAPEGTHVARCYSLVELGTQPGMKQGKWSRKIRIAWELPEEITETEDGKMPMVVGQTYTISLNEKATLRRDLESWRGRAFTTEELKGFDLCALLGKPCMLTIVHVDKDGNKRAKINSVSKLPKSVTCPPQVHPNQEYTVDQGPGGCFHQLPEWIQTIISECKEWNSAGQQTNTPETEAPPTAPGPEDDVPF